jgi:hypothetical protein
MLFVVFELARQLFFYYMKRIRSQDCSAQNRPIRYIWISLLVTITSCKNIDACTCFYIV